MKNHILPHTHQRNRRLGQFLVLRPLLNDLSRLLSLLAQVGAEGDTELARKAFDRGCKILSPKPLLYHPEGTVTFQDVNRILDKLFGVSPLLKKQILKACSITVLFDQQVNISEAELLRVIADSMGTPLPPLLKPIQASAE